MGTFICCPCGPTEKKNSAPLCLKTLGSIQNLLTCKLIIFFVINNSVCFQCTNTAKKTPKNVGVQAPRVRSKYTWVHQEFAVVAVAVVVVVVCCCCCFLVCFPYYLYHYSTRCKLRRMPMFLMLWSSDPQKKKKKRILSLISGCCCTPMYYYTIHYHPTNIGITSGS